MRFVIDETSWRFDGLSPAACAEALDVLLDQLDDARAQGHLVCHSDELFNQSVYLDCLFYDLFAPDSPLPIPREISERAAAIFNRLQKWQDLEPACWPPSFEVQVNAALTETATSIAWAHHQTCQHPAQPIACIIFHPGRAAGLCEVALAGVVRPLWFVANRKSYCGFFRWWIQTTSKNPGEMEQMATSAFPELDFIEGAFAGIKAMQKPYIELRFDLVKHLAVLSDQGARIFAGPEAKVAAEFAAFNLDISSENGDTKKNAQARNVRTRTHQGVATIFWWHTKLEPHQNRIHINPDNISAEGKRKLLVGIFCRHLVT